MNSESQQKKEIDPIEEIEKILSSTEKVEDTIEALLNYMKECLAQSDAPLFREFWEARKRSIPLFKEVSSAYARSTLWKQMMEITDQAKRIRDILDEKSAFHVEQIEIALQAIETDISQYEKLLSTLEEPNFSYPSFQKKECVEMQKEVDLLTNFSVRLSSLRKEILSLDMRMRRKNALLKKINSFQDQLLPKRKEMIKEISDRYLKEVSHFEEKYFSDTADGKTPYYQLKQDIKSLQADGKRLTILPQTFAETRKKLSSCWDLIREKELGKKAERSKLKEEEEKHLVAAREKIESLQKIFSQGDDLQKLQNSLKEREGFIRSLPLSKGSMKMLLQELDLFRKALKEKKEEAIKQEKEALSNLEQEIDSFLTTSPSQEKLEEKREEFVKRFEAIQLSSQEKGMLKTRLQKLTDQQKAKKEEEILEKDPTMLQEVLTQKEQRAKEIKARIEELKKEISSSNLDFAKAMVLQEMIEEEKLRLNNLNEEIASLEEE